MSHKYDEPPAYGAYGGGAPQPPEAAYQGYQQGYQQGPPQGNYYEPGPQMGYYQQHPAYGQPYPPQGGYYQQPNGYYRDNRSGPGCLEAMLAGLACCCCLDCLLF